MASEAMPFEGQDREDLSLQKRQSKFFERVLEELLEVRKATLANAVLQKSFFTFDEASWYLGISKSSLYKLTSGCLIPHYSPGGKLVYFKREDLDNYVLQKRCGTVAEIMAKGGKK